MSIKTNSLDYVIDKQKIEEKYDIFCLETSEKYIKRGAYILDVSVMCNDIKAIKFESGRKMLLLMSKNLDNKRKLKELLGEVTDGDKFSVLPVAISELKDHLLIQLLLNALGSYDSEFLKCNNLTGHLYCFHPYWIKRGKEKKEDIIWQVPCLEITVTEKLYVNLAVRTFTSERLKKKISFTKRKFEDYPKYIFSANNTLRRRLKGEEETCFILRQLDDRKTTLPFLEFQSLSKYEQSKMGVLNAVITTFNDKYEGICRLGFRKEPITQRVDYSKTVQRENIKRIKNVLNEKGIHIVDQINDAYSDIFCENIRTLLRQKYEIETTLGKRVSRDKLNIVLIHNAEYYNGVNDPHDKNYEGVAVQHITFENFSDSSEFAIATVMHEVIIKKDLEEKKISLFDWEKLGFTEPISFGMETEGDDIKHYFIMTVSPDGTFEMREQEMTLFEMNEYTEMIEIFEQARTDSEMVKGVIRFSDGSMNVIKDTGLFTIPEIDTIGSLLAEGDNKLRGRVRREELLASCLDIKMFEKDEKKYYCVGTIGEGMHPKIQRGCVIRKLEGFHGASVRFEKMLPMMNVSFVHNGQLTVIPFPFKYSREYINGVKM